MIRRQFSELNVVRAVADGLLDYGIVRDDALPAESKRLKLGQVGHALFEPKALANKLKSLQGIIATIPLVDLLACRPVH